MLAHLISRLPSVLLDAFVSQQMQKAPLVDQILFADTVKYYALSTVNAASVCPNNAKAPSCPPNVEPLLLSRPRICANFSGAARWNPMAMMTVKPQNEREERTTGHSSTHE